MFSLLHKVCLLKGMSFYFVMYTFFKYFFSFIIFLTFTKLPYSHRSKVLASLSHTNTHTPSLSHTHTHTHTHTNTHTANTSSTPHWGRAPRLVMHALSPRKYTLMYDTHTHKHTQRHSHTHTHTQTQTHTQRH